MGYYQPVRSVHSIGSHLRRAVGAVGHAAQKAAHGAAIGAGVLAAVGGAIRAKELYDRAR